jgi:hypothetical protein
MMRRVAGGNEMVVVPVNAFDTCRWDLALGPRNGQQIAEYI